MTVRRYQSTTDKEQALAVLKWGVAEQSKAVAGGSEEQKAWYRDSMAKSIDQEGEELVRPEDWWVAERDGAIVGVMRLMSEPEGRIGRYGTEGLLVIQELDARGAGAHLLEKAKRVAERRGKRSIFLLTVRGSKAHAEWYPCKGFVHFEDDGSSQMAKMILQLEGDA